MAIKIVDCSDVSPSHDAGEQSLPLVYFDFWWFQFPPTQSIYFYNLKCSQTYFLDKVVAQLKHSLSIALNHFTPLAGKMIFPLMNSAAMPVSRYAPGDGVALTIAVSDADFSDLTGNHTKAADDFHHLVPHLSPAEYSDTIEFRSIAIQATLFPNQGISIGFTHHHAICDAKSLVGFVGAWASVNELNSDGHLVGEPNLLPHYDRSRVQEATELSAVAWAEAAAIRPALPLVNYLPLHKLRATFILTDAQIERLKKLAMVKKPAMGRALSAFVVACAHLWSCLVKSGEEAAGDEPEYLTSPVDCRARLQPPLPDNYFGNCLVLMRAASTHGRLRGDEGFVAAAEAIADAVGKILRPGGGGRISDYVKHGRREIRSQLMGKRVVWLAGSSRMDHYGADYGWGRAIKYECIHTDHVDGNVNLCKGRDGGVEIGMSLPQAKMVAFAAVFNKYLLLNSNL